MAKYGETLAEVYSLLCLNIEVSFFLQTNLSNLVSSQGPEYKSWRRQHNFFLVLFSKLFLFLSQGDDTVRELIKSIEAKDDQAEIENQMQEICNALGAASVDLDQENEEIETEEPAAQEPGIDPGKGDHELISSKAFLAN